MFQEIQTIQAAIRRHFSWALLGLVVGAGACGGGADSTGPSPSPNPNPNPNPSPNPSPNPNPLPIQGRAIFGVDLGNRLLLFSSGQPQTLLRASPITGLPAGARIVGLDFRPGTGGLYGVGLDSRLYTIDTLSGAATAVGGAFTPALTGEHFGMAFDPSGAVIRSHSVETNQNLRIDPAGGAAQGGPDLAFAAGDPNEGDNPAIAGTAYAPDGALYAIDATANTLLRLDTPDTGVLATIGGLGVNAYLCVGFDIAEDGTAYAALAGDAGSTLYTVNLATGAAASVGAIGGGSAVQSIAIVPGAGSAQTRVAASFAQHRASSRTPSASGGCHE
ncbi:MAG TPA: DUF4394 domain-containing protein [Gemmatimonadales bacterium]|nr:DUF4394 domain-containing protein [Gemmatimonadales bacterium]